MYMCAGKRSETRTCARPDLRRDSGTVGGFVCRWQARWKVKCFSNETAENNNLYIYIHIKTYCQRQQQQQQQRRYPGGVHNKYCFFIPAPGRRRFLATTRDGGNRTRTRDFREKKLPNVRRRYIHYYWLLLVTVTGRPGTSPAVRNVCRAANACRRRVRSLSRSTTSDGHIRANVRRAAEIFADAKPRFLTPIVSRRPTTKRTRRTSKHIGDRFIRRSENNSRRSKIVNARTIA